MDPKTLKISELKEELTKRGLATTGLKADLVKCVPLRLTAAYVEKPHPLLHYPFPTQAPQRSPRRRGAR